MCELDKLFIILEISFSYLWDRNNDTHTEGLFQECNNECISISVWSLSHVWLCNPMDCSIPGLPVHHQLPEFTQTHVHWVGDAIQPSHPLSATSPPYLPQSFPASGFSQMSQFFTSGGQRIDAIELWCWRRLLRVPWTARRSKQSILKEISPEYSLEGLMLKLKLQYFGHLMWRTDSFEKTLMLGKIEGGREEKGLTEDEMVG